MTNLAKYLRIHHALTNLIEDALTQCAARADRGAISRTQAESLDARHITAPGSVKTTAALRSRPSPGDLPQASLQRPCSPPRHFPMVPPPPECYFSLMANFPTYKIVSAQHVAELEVEVNHLLTQGFELVGHPFPATYGDKTFILQGLLQPPAREEFELPPAGPGDTA